MANTTAIVAIGASTGGPGALAAILKGLKSPINVSLLIVQHIFPNGIIPLAKWLSQEAGIPVEVAKAGDILENGRVYLADGHGHLRINALGTLCYSQEPDLVHMPSIDVLFTSIATTWKGPALGILLTGMGSDGAKGLLQLRDNTFSTIAQDETTCVVYGMPKAAAKLNAAQRILPLAEISAHIGLFASGVMRGDSNRRLPEHFPRIK